ncbi:MAG: ferric reductase-like transmembrane domain-containing protein [Actinobacteria bacterium]|nr:ferric reductase-like transmembrane domain-containing protein [Actinomycetota bacterium]
MLLRVIPDIAAMATSPVEALRGVALHAGLFGYVAFATSLVLGARFPLIERAFGGLDRMYRLHRRLGAAAAGLLVVHVGSQIAVQVASDAGIVTLLRPDAGWRVFAGVLALAGLATVLTLTAVVRLRHERFLRIHRLLGLVFAVGAAHTLRVPAFAAQSSWLNGYLIAITLVGAAAWLYRSGLGRTLVRRHWYEVARIRTLHPTITELTLEPLDEPLDFRPGQLVFVGVDDDAVGRELHPFSITSPPGERTLRLVMKAVGDFTGRVPGVTPGSVCKVEGPYGTFWRSGATAARQIWIAGGSASRRF